MNRNTLLIVGGLAVLWLLSKKSSTGTPYYLAKPSAVDPARYGDPQWTYEPGY